VVLPLATVAVSNLSRDEILAILLREVELLAAEGEASVEVGQNLEERLRSIGDVEGAPKHCEVVESAETSVCGVAGEPEPFDLPEGAKIVRWKALREIVLRCPECLVHAKDGKKVVFGAGDLDAEIFFCGEAPGAEEEIRGEPFVGSAGRLLDKVIGAMGLSRKDVYIGNVMNWRPEVATAHGNRPPTQEEINFCMPFLRAQVEIVAPKVIVALGATAANGLLGYDGDRRMGETRGRWFDFCSVPTMVTYHPSHLLRNAYGAKRLFWEDMLQVMERLSMAISEKQRKFFL
jgi:DNA polymerase